LSIGIFGCQNPACRGLCDLPRQGAAIHQHFARCPHRRRTGTDLSALSELKKIFNVSEEDILNFLNTSDRFTHLPPVSPTARKIITGSRGKPCPLKTGVRWSPPTHGLGYGQLFAKIGTPPVSMSGPQPLRLSGPH